MLQTVLNALIVKVWYVKSNLKYAISAQMKKHKFKAYLLWFTQNHHLKLLINKRLLMTKCPYDKESLGEMSLRQSFLTAKSPHGELYHQINTYKTSKHNNSECIKL